MTELLNFLELLYLHVCTDYIILSTTLAYMYYLQDLIVGLATRMDAVEKTLETMKTNFERMTNEICKNYNVHVPREESRNNEIHGMTVPSSFGLLLLDMLFTKDELADSLLFQSPKSMKSALDTQRVQRLIGLVNKRYGDNWTIKLLTAKVNQKCRDTRVHLDEEEAM